MSLGLGKRVELEMRGRPADLISDLNLDNCRANKIEGLTSDFTNLQTLSLINLGLPTLEGFPKLGKLRKLELSDNRISGGLNHLTGCTNLTHLSLTSNKIKDFDVLDPLKDLKDLTSLDLFNCEVTNNEQYREKVFAKLPQIVYLDGFDREEKEQEDVDGEEDEDDDDYPISHSEGEDLPDPAQASPHREEQGEPSARRLLDLSFEPIPMALPGRQRGRAHPGSPTEQRLLKEYLAAGTALLQAKREALDNQEARERALFEVDLKLKQAKLARKRAELRHFGPSDAPEDRSDFK